MALSTTIIVERVLSRLPDNGRPYLFGPEIETWIAEGLYRVAWNNQGASEFLKTTTGLTIASGLLTITDTTLIMDSIPRGRVTVNATPAFNVPSYDNLRPAGLPLDVYYYTIEGLNLVFRNVTDGILGTAASAANVTVVATTVPTLANLPARFEPVLIEELVKLATDAIHAKKSRILEESDTTVDLAQIAQGG